MRFRSGFRSVHAANDSQFTWTDFVNRTNGELVANLGNFVNRSLRVRNVTP